MRTSLLSACLIFTCTMPAAAQDKARPNTLTPKEIADGWILLFDGETTFGWTAPVGSLSAENGRLSIGGAQQASAQTVASSLFAYDLQFESRAEGKDEGVRLAIMPGIVVGLSSDDKAKWRAGILQVRGGTEAVIDGNTFGGMGRIDPSWSAKMGSQLLLRNVKLRPHDMKPLFNGKDLTGWKVFPGRKSEFSVEDGAIVCKNGPGDLQTEGKYANFILQLECRSNGKHLNSGAFFRCKPNEYQNGYEAQIHNNFTADPPKTYVIEEYDPSTHELIAKKKVQSAASDYGTGAIYRRVPARKDVAKDGEWFTMTVVAHGNHIATWVNGVQQVDWYDNRPASDNPRTGCRLEAGHISFQGHDPTTNLSFRNIRIAELPAK
jgi:hypothetical protein